MKRCPFCAEEIQEAAIYCRFCSRFIEGEKTEDGISPAYHPKTPPKEEIPPARDQIVTTSEQIREAPYDGQTYCEYCLSKAPTKYVNFYKNIGMLVARQTSEVEGNLCKDCIDSFFWEFTGKTLFFGWWGTISLIITIPIIFNNILRYLGTLGMRRPALRRGREISALWQVLTIAVAVGCISFQIVGILLSTVYQDDSDTSVNTQSSCSYSSVENWFASTEARLSQQSSDNESWDPEAANLTTYISRAQTRYSAQEKQSTPECLDDLQELIVKVFYNDWKCYEAIWNGNLNAAIEYEERMFDLVDDASRELERFEDQHPSLLK